jgi:hypothetical protein
MNSRISACGTGEAATRSASCACTEAPRPAQFRLRLRMSADYAQVTSDTGLADLLLDTGRRWYGDDTDCLAMGEPSGDDF